MKNGAAHSVDRNSTMCVIKKQCIQSIRMSKVIAGYFCKAKNHFLKILTQIEAHIFIHDNQKILTF